MYKNGDFYYLGGHIVGNFESICSNRKNNIFNEFLDPFTLILHVSHIAIRV